MLYRSLGHSKIARQGCGFSVGLLKFLRDVVSSFYTTLVIQNPSCSDVVIEKPTVFAINFCKI